MISDLFGMLQRHSWQLHGRFFEAQSWSPGVSYFMEYDVIGLLSLSVLLVGQPGTIVSNRPNTYTYSYLDCLLGNRSSKIIVETNDVRDLRCKLRTPRHVESTQLTRKHCKRPVRRQLSRSTASSTRSTRSKHGTKARTFSRSMFLVRVRSKCLYFAVYTRALAASFSPHSQQVHFSPLLLPMTVTDDDGSLLKTIS